MINLTTPRLRGSLRWKLVLAAVLIEMLMLLMLYANTARLFNTAIEQQGAQQIRDLAPMFNVALAPALFSRDYSAARSIIDDLLRDSSGSLVYVVILDEGGRVFSQGGKVDADALPTVATIPNSSEVLFNGALPLHVAMQQVGELRYGLSFATLFDARSLLLQQGMLIALLGLTLTILGLSVAGYWLTRHIKKLVEASRAIAAGRYDVKADVNTTDEIGQLAQHFNEMGAAISSSMRDLLVKDAAMESANSAIAIAGMDGKLSYVNHAFVELWCLQGPEDAIGRSLSEFCEKPDVAREVIKDMQQQGRWQGELCVSRDDGSVVELEISMSLVMDISGNPVCMMAWFVDISKRKLAQITLMQINEELEQRTVELLSSVSEAERANSAKSEFLARMSHELRTPMNGILGFAQLLAYDPGNSLDAEQVDYVQEIVHAGEHLLELINEVLDLARIESGRVELLPEPLAIAQLVRECVPLVQTLAARNKLRVSVDLTGDYVIRADRLRLRQILLNLLSNAVKYNCEGGSIEISCLSVRSGWVRIAVNDSGRGIAADALPRLFLPFERVQSVYDGIEGAGIGLAISRRLTEAMGGIIGVESVAGAGSTFWVEFPLDTGEDVEPLPDLGAMQTALPNSRTLLYIEDNPSSLRLVQKSICSRLGLVMLNAHTAELGLEMARTHRPDIILLDFNLPGMNGFDALSHLQNDIAIRDIPVIAIIDHVMERDIKKIMDAGFVDYLTKPLDIILLIVLLSKLLERQRYTA